MSYADHLGENAFVLIGLGEEGLGIPDVSRTNSDSDWCEVNQCPFPYATDCLRIGERVDKATRYSLICNFQDVLGLSSLLRLDLTFPFASCTQWDSVLTLFRTVFQLIHF